MGKVDMTSKFCKYFTCCGATGWLLIHASDMAPSSEIFDHGPCVGLQMFFLEADGLVTGS